MGVTWIDNKENSIFKNNNGETLLIKLKNEHDGITHTDEDEGNDITVDLSWLRSEGKAFSTTGNFTDEQIVSWAKI